MDGRTPVYHSATTYGRISPEYTFAGVPSNRLFASRIADLLERVAGKKLIDCGAGPGFIWDLLTADVEIVAVEPERSMWRSPAPPNVTYVEDNGLRFLLTSHVRPDVVSWLWSLNYALASFFESIDVDRGLILRNDFASADAYCRAALLSTLRRQRSAITFVAFFDSGSVEQQFVTEIWSRVASLPAGDRSYTRSILEWALELMRTEGMTVTVEHLRGWASYGDASGAAAKIRAFHFHEFPGIDNDAIEAFCDANRVHDEVACEAGVYLYTAKPETVR